METENNKINAESVFQKHWIKTTSKPIDDVIKSHMRYVIDAMEDYADQKSKSTYNGVYELNKVIVHNANVISEKDDEIKSLHITVEYYVNIARQIPFLKKEIEELKVKASKLSDKLRIAYTELDRANLITIPNLKKEIDELKLKDKA